MVMLGFLGLNIALTMAGYLEVNLIPVVLGLALLTLLAFDQLILLSVFLTPLSVNLSDIGFGIGLDFPTDLINAGLMLLIILKFLAENRFDVRVFTHPLSILIALNLAWLLLTAFTSSMPVVSFKYFLSRFWFIVVFYFTGTQLFKKERNLYLFPWLYIISLTLVTFYTYYQHSEYNFDQHASYGVCQPFYMNHGIYGAALAFFIPVAAIFVLKGDAFGYSYSQITMAFAILINLLIAVVFSYTRAAWISLAVAIVLAVIVLLRPRLVHWVLGIIFITIIGFGLKDQIENALAKNKQDSASNFEAHVKSIYNVSTDDSNLERINRWKSAWRMFCEHPILGFGAGTYPFKYAPYQLASEQTRISTNFGNRGNAHSEYLNPLAETGLPGLLTYVAIILYAIFRCWYLFYRIQPARLKWTLLFIMLALVTYYTHGFLNIYIEYDKVATPIWGFLAMITAIDIYHRKNTSETEAA